MRVGHHPRAGVSDYLRRGLLGDEDDAHRLFLGIGAEAGLVLVNFLFRHLPPAPLTRRPSAHARNARQLIGSRSAAAPRNAKRRIEVTRFRPPGSRPAK